MPPGDPQTVNRDRRDRILDWRDELRRLEPELPALPPAAQEAVRATVEAFLREDAALDASRVVALDDAA